MVAFAGVAYDSNIEVTEVSLHPADVGGAWLQGRDSQSFNADDDVAVLASPGMIDSRTFAVSTEGALEWYAGFSPLLGRGRQASIALPGISRMYLPMLETGYGYALVFHLLNTDCGSKNTLIAGERSDPTVINGGIAHYSATQASVFFAARADDDGGLEVYIRPTDIAQEIRLFERDKTSVLQNVLLATAEVGQTLRLRFSPSTTFVPFVVPKAVAVSGSQAVFSAALAPFQVLKAAGARVFRDAEVGGFGEFPFKVEGLSGSQTAKVTLQRARDKMVARQTWSAADGTGKFTGLDVNTKFIALAEDPSGQMHPVAAAHYPVAPGGD